MDIIHERLGLSGFEIRPLSNNLQKADENVPFHEYDAEVGLIRLIHE